VVGGVSAFAGRFDERERGLVPLYEGGSDGTPFVLAFIGDLWSDANLLAWAYDLERATMARVAPRLSELRGSGGGGRRSR